MLISLLTQHGGALENVWDQKTPTPWNFYIIQHSGKVVPILALWFTLLQADTLLIASWISFISLKTTSKETTLLKVCYSSALPDWYGPILLVQDPHSHVFKAFHTSLPSSLSPAWWIRKSWGIMPETLDSILRHGTMTGPSQTLLTFIPIPRRQWCQANMGWWSYTNYSTPKKLFHYLKTK